jgi:hypothetical protein
VGRDGRRPVSLRGLLIVTQTAYGVLAAALWALAVAGQASVAAIVAISVAGGVVGIVGSPARQASVSSLVTVTHASNHAPGHFRMRVSDLSLSPRAASPMISTQ